LLDISHVTKRYRRRTGAVLANDDVSLRLGAGEVVGLLGHNGAGKTTLVNQIVGLAAPTSGRITLDGHDLVAQPALARRLVSLQPQGQVPLDGITPRQAIELLGRLRGGGAATVRRRTTELIAALDIEEWATTVGNRLSGGVRRLVGFCMAAVVPGLLVTLDEPTNDVDPVRRTALWSLVRRLGDEGHAVLLVSHNVAEVERAVDRLVVLDRGRVVAEGTPSALKARVSNPLRLQILLAPGVPVPEAPYGEPSTLDGRWWRLHVAELDVAPAVAWARDLAAAGTALEFSLTPTSLEDVYVELVGGRTVDREGVEVVV